LPITDDIYSITNRNTYQLNTKGEILGLNLCQNQIRDINSIANLTHLKKLYLNKNLIGDISALSNLTQLIGLNLGNNQIVDLSPLENLNELKKLILDRNKINDIEYIVNLKQLTLLSLSDNKVNDLSSIASLTELTQLYLIDNQISDITALKDLKQLTNLHLDSNQISDITALKDLKQLTDLDLINNQISDITALKDLKELTNLNLWSNQISDITALKDLTKLTFLNLRSNQISDITALKDLKELTNLKLWNNQISDITALKDLKQLTYLHLDSNQISDITALKDLKQLKHLYLTYNQISNITTLKDLTKLTVLDLMNNPIYAEIPAETYNAGAQAILLWLRETNEIENKKLIALNHAKVLLLGNTNVGKSDLAYYLQYEEIRTPGDSTHGLEYYSFKKFNSNLHIYDFGGQEFFHGTHQLFFSEGALNLVLWSKDNIPRAGQIDRCFELNYWLQCVQQLVNEKEENTIETIVIENKIDYPKTENKNVELFYKPTMVDYEKLNDTFKYLNINHTAVAILHQQRLKGLEELIEERITTLPALKKTIYTNLC
jgi:internalin A